MTKLAPTIDFPRPVGCLGRNGPFKARGMDLTLYGDEGEVEFRPITTRGLPASCRVCIPADKETLRAVAGTLAGFASQKGGKGKEEEGLDRRETATLLAALRLFQRVRKGHNGGFLLSEVEEHFADTKPLSNKEIDALCERINFAPKGKE